MTECVTRAYVCVCTLCDYIITLKRKLLCLRVAVFSAKAVSTGGMVIGGGVGGSLWER